MSRHARPAQDPALVRLRAGIAAFALALLAVAAAIVLNADGALEAAGAFALAGLAGVLLVLAGWTMREMS